MSTICKDAAELRAAVESSLRALNEARGFSFSAGANPLRLPVNGRGEAKSYDLAARLTAILAATKP